MGSGDLLYLTLLFGGWLAAVACIIGASVRGEAGGRSNPSVRALARSTAATGVGLVVAYLVVALPAFWLVPMDSSYSIIVAAFAAAMAVQGALAVAGLVRARRLRMVG
jgi:hypothetical protein